MRIFMEHPESVGETYTEHMGMALSFSVAMFRAAGCCFVHAFLPFLFKTTGRDTITELHHRMVTHRDRRISSPIQAPAE
ncbi:MAG: DUF6356 family protein [Pseudomonadota bacterium]